MCILISLAFFEMLFTLRLSILYGLSVYCVGFRDTANKLCVSPKLCFDAKLIGLIWYLY